MPNYRLYENLAILLPMFFPAQSQHDMFLMRKNHLDFKAVAQALAMDKAKLEDYIMVSLLHMLSYNSTTCQCPICTGCPIPSCTRGPVSKRRFSQMCLKVSVNIHHSLKSYKNINLFPNHSVILHCRVFFCLYLFSVVKKKILVIFLTLISIV